MLRRAIGYILLAGMILALLPSALRADSNVANPEDLFPIVRDAGGVRLHGQLAIYYDVTANDLGCGLDQVNMFFVFRLQKSEGAPAGFAGSLKTGSVRQSDPGLQGLCYEDSDVQIAAVLQFVNDTVIPYFFPHAQSRTFNLTDVNQIVQDGEAQDVGGICVDVCTPYFFLMNVEFRVRG